MRVASVVQAHPVRREMATRLAGRIDGRVVYDPRPDDARRCPWRTYAHALCDGVPDDPTYTHVCVVQDDALVCDYFPETVTAVADARPGNPVALFVPGAMPLHRDAVHLACAQDRTLTVLPDGHWMPVVAMLWPIDLICPLLDWVAAQNYPPAFCSDDEIVGRATRDIGIDVWATVPSIAEHPDDVVSLIGNHRPMAGRNLDRVAACFVGEHYDGRTLTWTTE